MRKKRQFKAGRCYHLVSRIAHRAFFFDEEEKNRFVELLMRVEYFSGVRLIGWCVMSNHIHVYVFLEEGHEVGEGELLAKINRLYRGTRLDEVLKEWKTLRESSDGAIAGSCDFEAFKQSFVDRMFHPSEFMKTLKHHYTSSYNGRRNHSGTMWEGRFHHRESKRASVEMSAVAAYIDCNPCEGGICKWPTEYKWCGWTAATEGDERCRAMYRFIYGATVEDENDWSAIVKRHEEAIRRRLVEIEEDERAGRACDSIFGRLVKGGVEDDDEASTHAAGVAPIDQPEKWDVQLERGSNAVAAKLLTLLEGGEKSAAEIAEALEIKSRPFLTNRYLVPLMAKGLIRQTLPDKPKSRFQRYALA